jgi:Flp pilus assembly protein TadG
MKTVHSLPRLVQSLRHDEQGSVMAWTALGILSLLGMAALTVDMGYMYVLNNQLQTTADAAASAAVKELPDETAALAAAQDIVQKNMHSSAHGNVITADDVQFGNWDSATRTFTDGGSPVNAVRVNARRDSTNNNAARTFFASALGFSDVSIGAQAIALQGGGGGQACLISLDTGNTDDALHMNSNAQIDLQGCGVRVNSTSSTGLSLNANAYMHAEAIQVAGSGFEDGVNTDVAPPPDVNAGQITDPLEHLQDMEPSPVACTSGNRVNRNFKTSQTILPGTYCGGIRIGFSGGPNPDSGCGGGGAGHVTITMAPGTYILTDSSVGQPQNCGGPVTAGTRRAGMLQLAANTTLNATGGVFIFITGATNVNGTNPIVDLDSNSSVNLVAPSDPHPFAGIAIYQDNDLTGLTNRMNSNSNKNYKGAIYFPTNDLLMDSNGEINTNTECSVLIARRFQFDSNARLSGTFDLSENCPASLATAMEGTGGGGGSTTTTLVK